MAIKGIKQPEIIQLDDSLRLRKFDGKYDFALEWYQDLDLVWMVVGDRVPYTPELLTRMYTWLDNEGELYFIEILEEGEYLPVGDVCLWKEDMPIVISTPYQKKGIYFCCHNHFCHKYCCSFLYRNQTTPPSRQCPARSR